MQSIAICFPLMRERMAVPSSFKLTVYTESSNCRKLTSKECLALYYY